MMVDGMRTRRFYLSLIAGVVLVGMLAFGVFRDREPEYGGKRLSQWVMGYSFSQELRDSAKNRAEAIRGIGTNALPYLQKWIRYDTPPWKSKLYRIINPTLMKIQPSWQLTDEDKQMRADGAVFAFITLGPAAGREIAELSRLRTDPGTSPVVRMRAENVLNFIDSRSWKDFRNEFRYVSPP